MLAFALVPTSLPAGLSQRLRQQQQQQAGRLGSVPARQARRLPTRAQLGPVSEAKPGQGLSPELRNAIKQFIKENKIVAFIKGTKQFPMCGFSNTVVSILNSYEVPYVTVNVLEDDLLRSGMKEYSEWPTFPQVYIGGDFFGGCDIMIQSYQSGELSETLEKALNE